MKLDTRILHTYFTSNFNFIVNYTVISRSIYWISEHTCWIGKHVYNRVRINMTKSMTKINTTHIFEYCMKYTTWKVTEILV